MSVASDLLLLAKLGVKWQTIMAELETTLDRFGRVLLPKVVRARLGISAGQVLEIEAGYDEVVLRPVRPRADLELREGILLYTGGELEGTVEDVVQLDRERRMRKVAWPELE